MTPARFNQCLRLLRWPSSTLADMLELPSSTTSSWLIGEQDVPTEVAEWLETLVKALEALPPPKVGAPLQEPSETESSPSIREIVSGLPE